MSKIASKTIAVVVTLLLAISFVVTGSFIQSVTKLAAEEPATTIKTGVTNRVKYGQTFTVDANNGVKVSVKTPGGTYAQTEGDSPITLDGKTVLNADVQVKAAQVGIYEITYSNPGNGKYASYTYNVESYMDYEYLFVVDGYGASIPTYWGKSDTTEFALPSATLYYYDEDLEKYIPDNATSDIYCKVTIPGKGELTPFTKAQLDAGEAKVNPSTTGTYFFTYYAEVAAGDNLFSEEYTMQVQDSFSDTKAPTLTISDVPSSSSSNTQIKLPVATVTDDYDTRVNTKITVMHDYGAGLVEVPETVIDQDTGYVAYDSENRALYYKADDKGGYSYKDGVLETTVNVAEAVKANFDNKNFMNFYPTEDGEYKVTYSAEDSTGKYEDKAANKTVDYAYNIRVSDTTAPVYKKMDESLIPSTWGKSVYKYSEEKDTATNGGTITEKVTNTDIRFPIPELYDNKDADSALRVSFTLSDKNSKTVMSFDNIYSSDAKDGKYAATSEFGSDGATYYFYRYWLSQDYKDGKLKVDEKTGAITGGDLGDKAYSLIYYDKEANAVTKGFFNFNLWKVDDSLGNYTVTYRAKDTQGNSSTKTYNISLQNRFEDTSLPTVDFNEPDYFVFRNYETEQSITDVSATDSNDARLDVQYYLLFNMNFTAEDDGSYDFDTNIKDENVDDWKAKGNLVELSATLGTNKAKLEKTAGGAYTFTIDDKEGKEQVVTLEIANYKNVFVAMKATDSAGNTSDYVKAVKLVDGTTEAGKTYAPKFGNVNTTNGKVGEEYNFGSFQINYADNNDRAYTGFEIYVQRVKAIKDNKSVDVQNEPLTNVSFETYSDNRATGGTNMLHVDNIRFTPSKSGTYMIVIRGFHVSGASSVAMFFREVAGTESDVVDAKAVLGDKLNYNTTYSLPDNYTGSASWAEKNAGLLRSITGGRFTLMGSEFTAKATTTYNFSDYTFEYTNKDGKIVTTENTGTNGVNLGSLVKYNYQSDAAVAGVCYGLSLAKDASNSADRSPLIDGKYEAKSNYTSTFTDTQTATFRLIDRVMPTYVEKSTGDKHSYVELPNISASSVNGNATSITCEVTDPKGNSVEVYDAEDELPDDFAGTLVGNQFMFEATTNGAYTVNYTATLNNQQATVSYTIRAGDVIAPDFKVGLGYVNDVYNGSNTSASVNDVFDFAAITEVADNESITDCKFSKKLITPENETLAEVTSQTKKNNGSSYTLTLGGTYRVVYTVTDAAGNTTTQNYSITVTSSSSNVSTEAITTLSVVLIVVGVLLIAGIIVYLVRFRKRKPAKA